MRNIQTTLQKDEHTAVHNIILSPPKQWSGGGMHRICGALNKNPLY